MNAPSHVTYIDPMLPRMSDAQLRLVIQQASALLSYRRGSETMDDIAARVAGLYGWTLDELKGRPRTAPLSLARQEAFWRIYDTGRYTLTQIGKCFGRDHTTIRHGVLQHEARLATQQVAA